MPRLALRCRQVSQLGARPLFVQLLRVPDLTPSEVGGAHIVEAQFEALRILIMKMSVSPGRIPALD